MRDINIKAEDIDIINTEFSEKEKESLLRQINKSKLIISFNKDRSKLIKILAENSNVNDIQEKRGSVYRYNPIEYTYKNNLIEIIIVDVDRIYINKTIDLEINESGCQRYEYKATSINETLKILDKLHDAMDIGII